MPSVPIWIIITGMYIRVLIRQDDPGLLLLVLISDRRLYSSTLYPVTVDLECDPEEEETFLLWIPNMDTMLDYYEQ